MQHSFKLPVIEQYHIKRKTQKTMVLYAANALIQ